MGIFRDQRKLLSIITTAIACGLVVLGIAALFS